MTKSRAGFPTATDYVKTKSGCYVIYTCVVEYVRFQGCLATQFMYLFYTTIVLSLDVINRYEQQHTLLYNYNCSKVSSSNFD